MEDMSNLQSANTTGGLNFFPFEKGMMPDKSDSMLPVSSKAHTNLNSYKQWAVKGKAKDRGKDGKQMWPVQKLLKSLEKDVWLDRPN